MACCRNEFMDLHKEQQDLVLLGHIEMHRRQKGMEFAYAKTTERGISRFRGDSMTRTDVRYFFSDLQICREMYFFLHDLGSKRYRNLLHHFDENGLSLRVHQSTKKKAKRDNVLLFEETSKIVTFIETFSESVAIPLPGRMPKFRDYRVMKLPSSENKISVYNRYKKACEKCGERLVARSTFCEIWSRLCPYIATMKPADDLCNECHTNSLTIARMSNLSDTEKNETLQKAMKHLEAAKEQRDYYNYWRNKAASGELANSKILSFDYAQNVSFPSSPQQVGVSYFKALRKCSIFGIHDEATKRQCNILIDEEDSSSAGKGANSVISMLDFYLNKYPSEFAVLFADNCAGQNKNNSMIQYLLWRVMTGKNKTISLNFMLTGHTKFSPDRNFGILKSKYAKANVNCLQDVVEIVNCSSPNGFNFAIPSIDPTTKTRNITWARWDQFLKKSFKPIPGISKYHHFFFHCDGRITAKALASSDEIVIRKESELLVGDTTDLEKIIPSGLSSERQWYLFQQVRPLCTNDLKADFLAPEPSSKNPRKRCKAKEEDFE